jgi:hypothetical protein
MSGLSPAEQQQQLAEFAQRIQQQVQLQVQAALAAHSQSPPGGGSLHPPAPRAPEPRMPPPHTFEGRTNTLDTWLAALSRQFAWYGYASPANDAQRIRFATGYLSAAAWDWWEHAPSALHTGSWSDFVDALRKRFQPVTAAETARVQLRRLAQGKSSVHDYVSAFRRLLVSVPSMSEDDRLFQFLQGLQPSISQQLRIHAVKTVDAAIEMATRIGSLGEFNAALAAASASSTGSSSAQQPSPMELDAILNNIEGLEGETQPSPSAAAGTSAPVTRAELLELLNAVRDEQRNGGKGYRDHGRRGGAPGGPRIPHLSPEQVQQLMRDGKCFGCGSTEHQARKCPKRKVGADGRVSWSSN